MVYRAVLMLLLVAGAVTPAYASGKTTGPAPTTADQTAVGNAASTTRAAKPNRDQDRTVAQSEQSKAQDVQSLLDDAASSAGQRPQMSPADPSAALPPEDRAYRQELLQQIADARRNLAKARKQLSGTSQEAMLDLAGKLLNMAQARLLDKPGALSADQAQQEMAVGLNQAQQRLEALREQAGKTSDPDGLRKRIDKAELRLNEERQQLSTMLTTSGSPDAGKVRLRRLYAYAQQRLDDARARAATLPNSKQLLAKLDAAQHRLDAAAARFGIQPASPAN